MKSVLSLAVLSFLALAPAAHSANKYYKIDLRKDFRSTSVNLYPDGTPVYSGVDIVIPAMRGYYTIQQEKFGEATCKILSAASGSRGTNVRISTDIEIDDGACEFTIRLRDGRKATVHVENVGT